MTKLMEHVRAIQAKAHVCPECRGAKRIDTAQGKKLTCWICHGKGTIDAPDIDALVGVIENMVAAVEHSACDLCPSLECYECYDSPIEVLKRMFQTGLPGEEVKTNDQQQAKG
jgi:hypothetical protein